MGSIYYADWSTYIGECTVTTGSTDHYREWKKREEDRLKDLAAYDEIDQQEEEEAGAE
jgi:hypothetical protein